MRKFFFLLLIVTFVQSCTSEKQFSFVFESEDLKIEQISSTIFRHISYLKTEDFGNVSCNGMVYINENEAVVFDTPTNAIASKELINWFKNTKKVKITAIIATHFHDDCLGDLQSFHDNDIASYATEKTIKLASAVDVKILPKNSFKNTLELTIGKETVKALYFGEGHTVDNIIGYIPSEKAMFGGCLVKKLKASKGYLGDANATEWSNTINKIKASFPEVEIVIPGHGKSGGIDLLTYTSELFKQ